jgi:branched-chain amino acid transport system substrate-binding protein
MKTLRIIALAVLCAVLGAESARAADPTFDVNVVLPLTGQAAFIGQSQQVGLRAAELVVNRGGGIRGRPLHFAYFDDQSNPQQTVLLVNQLLARKLPAIIGPSFTATCRAVMPVLEKGPVSYCLSPGIDPPAGSYVFSAGASVKDFARVMYRFASLHGWKRWAMVTTTDATGQVAEAVTAELLKEPEFKDITVATAVHFNVTDLDMTAQMSIVKAAKPDMVMAWPSGAPFGTVLRGLVAVGLDVPVFSSGANLSYDQLKQYGDLVPKELYFESSPNLINVAANRSMASRQNDLNTALTALSLHGDVSTGTTFDVGWLLAAAFNKVGTDATADQIRDYLANLVDFSGASGVYDFHRVPQRGLATRDLIILRYDRSKGVMLQASKLGGEPLH